MDERNKRIVMEACSALENIDLGTEVAEPYKTEAMIKNLASIIRIATGLQLGGGIQ